MGFFDNIFKRGKAYTASQNPNLACEFTMEGRRYMLEEFDLDFDSVCGKKYVPMYAVFSERLAPELESWITRGSHRKEGTVKFFRNTDAMEEGALFTLKFYDAACVRIQKTTRGETPLTTIVMAARKINMLGQEN